MDTEIKELTKERLFTSSQVLEAVNITYRQLSYWELKGLITPTYQRLGSRDFKRYSQQDIDTLKTIKKLLDEGYSLPATDTLKEIAKRKEAEKALRESREKYRALAESSVNAIFIHARDGRYLYANLACTKLFGRKPDEIVGKKLTDFFVKEKAKEVFEGIQRVFSENKVVHIEYSLSLEGGVHYFFATLSPIYSVQGDVLSVMRVVHDITQRKKTEEALRTSEQKFKDLTEATTDWIWEVDKDGVYTYVSPKVKQFLGYEVSEVLGKTPFDFMPKEEAKRVGEIFNEKVISKKPFYKLENVNRRKDGHLVVLETNGIPIFDEKDQLKGYRGIDRDITQRKKTEEQIKSYQKKIEIIVDSSSDLIFLKDRDFRYLIANKVHEKLFNIKIENIIGKTDFDFMPKELAEGCRKSDEEALKSKHPIEREEFVGDRCFDVVKQKVVDVNGNIIGIAAVIRDITQRKKTEEEREKLLRDIGERVKELDCLYGLSRLVEKRDTSLEEIFRGMVNLIPPAWRYSNITCARIVLEDKEFKTDNYKMSKWKQSADIKVHGKKAGVVEVCYLEEKLESYEGLFTKEERDLIEAIAERLGKITERKKTEEIKKSFKKT